VVDLAHPAGAQQLRWDNNSASCGAVPVMGTESDFHGSPERQLQDLAHGSVQSHRQRCVSPLRRVVPSCNRISPQQELIMCQCRCHAGVEISDSGSSSHQRWTCAAKGASPACPGHWRSGHSNSTAVYTSAMHAAPKWEPVGLAVALRPCMRTAYMHCTANGSTPSLRQCAAIC
jgi:hypothetical protein